MIVFEENELDFADEVNALSWVTRLPVNYSSNVISLFKSLTWGLHLNQYDYKNIKKQFETDFVKTPASGVASWEDEELTKWLTDLKRISKYIRRPVSRPLFSSNRWEHIMHNDIAMQDKSFGWKSVHLWFRLHMICKLSLQPASSSFVWNENHESYHNVKYNDSRIKRNASHELNKRLCGEGLIHLLNQWFIVRKKHIAFLPKGFKFHDRSSCLESGSWAWSTIPDSSCGRINWLCVAVSCMKSWHFLKDMFKMSLGMFKRRLDEVLTRMMRKEESLLRITESGRVCFKNWNGNKKKWAFRFPFIHVQPFLGNKT